MDMLFELILIMIVLEFLEAYIHQADTLGEMIEKLYSYYKKSIFLFFIIHPTLYFIFFILLSLKNINLYAIILLALKVFDLFFKMEMIQQRYIRKNMGDDLLEMLDMKLSTLLSFLGVLLYVPLFFMAISL